MIDAKQREIRKIVLAAPGSGVFANGDQTYLNTVMAAADATRNHGVWFEEFVIFHRRAPRTTVPPT